MIEPEAFAVGLARVALGCRETVDTATHALYYELIGPETNSQEWARFTTGLARHPPRRPDGSARFPSVAEILDALQEFRGRSPLEVEATQAYERVVASSNYTPNGGASWAYRDVRERCGAVAAEAFLAAGGHHAFATTWDESRRRERFLAAYQAEARERPQARLLPASGSKALPSGQEQLTNAEAAKIVAMIARRAKVAK